MVGPSLSDDERDAASFRLKLFFVLLVGASGGLIALQVDPTPVELALSILGGLLLGWLLLVFLVRSFRQEPR
ncbi:hypothetical protein [Haloprofundus halophilus]|uniref:hypothetical protein n=1 Tax=Haloprofundus halophilus TaxID=2283527 RepID=UPI000E433E44|nr:hypothetical protein [Haloprofundus halophilus]